MWGGFYQKYKQTILASLFAVALIGTSYYTRTHVASSSGVAMVAVSDEKRPYRENKDTDGDGMRDWEEDTRGTNPLVPDKPSDYATAQSGGRTEDIPDTTTSRFSRSFFEEYLRKTADGSMSEEEKAAFLQKSLAEASVNAKDTLYARGDISISFADDPAAIRQYGNTLGYILSAEQVDSDNELFIVQRALQTESPETLESLDPLITAYKHMLQNTKELTVPAPLVNEHLLLLNTLLALHNDIVAMRNIFDDGLPGIVRVKRYTDDVDALNDALVALHQGLARHGGVFDESEWGSFFGDAEAQ